MSTDNDHSPERGSASAEINAGCDGSAHPDLSIPDHTLLKPIGRGSYGEVWMARSSMGMLRAVKIVYRKTFKDKRPFERELSGIRKFEPISRSHEGFIDVLHAGINEEKGYFYYIMELGDDLKSNQDIDPSNYTPRTLSRDLKPGGKLPAERCLTLGLGLSQALAQLHKHGLVHRDIKPSNIIFVNGVPKLADIGLVADIDEARSYVGTEGFIPPEGPGTPQADIYGLGKVLYEASTGKDRQDFPELPTNWDQDPGHELFVELNEVILQACKTGVTRRYRSAEDMHADLVLLSNGKSVKRLKLLERRLARLRNFAVVTGIALFVLAAISYQVYWQWRSRFEARQRQVGGNVVKGTLAVESGDPFAALSYFLQALALDQGDVGREGLHRLQLGTVLSECPKLERLIFFPGDVAKLSLSRDQQHVLASQFGGLARILDLKTGKIGPDLPPRSLFGASYSPDGNLAVTADYVESTHPSGATILRLSDMQSLLILPHPDRVLSACFSSNGLQVLTACKDGIARVWSAREPFVLRKLARHSDAVLDAEYSPDGNWIVTCSRDGTAILWNVGDDGPEIQKVLPHGAGNWVNCAAFSPDSRLVVTGCSDHKVRIFEVETSRQILPDLNHNDGVSSVQFSPDGRFILTAGLDYTARLWLTDTHQPLLPAGVLSHSGRVVQAIFAPDGHHVFTCCDDGSVRVWNLAGEDLLPMCNNYCFSENGKVFLERSNDMVQVKQSGTEDVLSYWTNSIQDISFEFSQNGRFVASYQKRKDGQKTTVEVQDAASSTIIGPGMVVSNLAKVLVLDDGKTMISVAEGDLLQRWVIPTGTAIGPAFQHRERIVSAFISPDGTRIGAWSTNYVSVWDLSSGREMFRPIKPGVPLSYATFSPDSSLLVVCYIGDGFAKCAAHLYNVADGKSLPFQLNHDDGVIFAAFSRDGRRIVTASEDFTARVWDSRTGIQLTPPLKHADQVRMAVFSPDGKWILTASSDRTARIWSAETGDPLTPPLRHIFRLQSAVFEADALQVLTVDTQSHQWLWKLNVEKRSVPEVSVLAQVMSGSTLTRWGGLSSANTNSLRFNWNQLQASRPGDFAVSDSQNIAWHDFQAQQCEFLKDWSAASFHLEQMLLFRSDDASFKARLSAARANLKNAAR
jgi:WD40 repeat protein